jgi:parallel beta-helix repeat protein
VISNVEEYGIKITDSNPQIRSNVISGSIYNIECAGSNSTIENNTLYDAVDSIRLISCQDVLIKNNDIFGNLKYGIRSEKSSPKIIDNYIKENGEGGIWFYICYGGEVFSNLLIDNYRGIEIQSSREIEVMDNQIVNCSDDGIYSEDSKEFTITNNIFDGGGDGIFLKDSNNISINLNSFLNQMDKSIRSFNSSTIQIEKNTILTNNIGIFLFSSNATLANCSINETAIWAIQLGQNSTLISLNSTFSKDRAIVPVGCVLTVKNYLHIFVQNDTYAPYKSAAFDIKDGNTTIYSIQTDDFGYFRFLVVTDRIHMGSNLATENETLVEIMEDSLYFLENPRNVDMSFSHVEVFSPGNPLDLVIDSPYNQSLVFDTMNITGTAGNQGSEDITIEIRVDGGEWILVNFTGDDWTSWWLSYDTNSLPDGEHVIHARITSSLYTKVVSKTILVDNIGNKPPAVLITSHEQNDIVNGTIEVKGTSIDFDGVVESVKVKIDNGIFKDAEMVGGNWSSWSFTLDTKEFPNGTYIITVIAFDNATDSTTVSLELVFENEDGGSPENGEDSKAESEDDSANWWVLFLIILVIVIVLIVILMKKRNQKEMEED